MRKTIAIIFFVAALALNGRAENKVDFAKSVQGIFEARCIDCHGPKKQKGDLRLDSQEAALAEVIKPGKSGESELYKHISLPADHEDIMPAKGGYGKNNCDCFSHFRSSPDAKYPRVIHRWQPENCSWPSVQ